MTIFFSTLVPYIFIKFTFTPLLWNEASPSRIQQHGSQGLPGLSHHIRRSADPFQRGVAAIFISLTNSTAALHIFLSPAHLPQVPTAITNFLRQSTLLRHHPPDQMSVYHAPALHFLAISSTLSLHTLLIHVPKPEQQSLVHSTCRLSFHSYISKDLFIPHSVRAWHTHHTSEALNFQDIQSSLRK